MSECSRCGKPTKTVFIFRAVPGGHSWASTDFTPTPPTPPEDVCGACITDEELARMLHPVVEFVLETMPRDPRFPDHAVALETVTAMFKVRNNDPFGDNRQAALGAVGLDQSGADEGGVRPDAN